MFNLISSCGCCQCADSSIHQDAQPRSFERRTTLIRVCRMICVFGRANLRLNTRTPNINLKEITHNFLRFLFPSSLFPASYRGTDRYRLLGTLTGMCGSLYCSSGIGRILTFSLSEGILTFMSHYIWTISKFYFYA
jgi:hypothetical protein